jgi:alkanesulfonate monooxygenase SsuD/methylene tetrahydromethanopterin reductase-like flavin-dependent oxidoreductase (luciferase family)
MRNILCSASSAFFMFNRFIDPIEICHIVAGWHRPEYEALGIALPNSHEVRYGYAKEWFDIIKKLWHEEDYFDWEGNYFKLKRVKGDPRPVGKVPIINAS